MTPRATRRRGMTLVEMLIGIVLTAMLLGSIAVATRASLHSYDQNEETVSADGFLRMLLMRLRSEIRTAEAVDFNAPDNQLIITPPENAQGITQIRYEYNYATRSLVYHRTIDGQTVSQTLADAASPVRIQWFLVTYYTAEDDLGTWYTQRVVVQFYVGQDGQYRTVTCSAAPRRNVQY